jgi:hypothetical protein
MVKKRRRKTANNHRSAWRPLERGVAAGIGMYALGMGLNALRRR